MPHSVYALSSTMQIFKKREEQSVTIKHSFINYIKELCILSGQLSDEKKNIAFCVTMKLAKKLQANYIQTTYICTCTENLKGMESTTKRYI